MTTPPSEAAVKETRQDWDPERYAARAAFVPELGRVVVDLLDPRPGERILDLGCGDGALTAAIVARGATVVGVDSSDAMVAAARARGIDARLADGAALPFTAEFDAVFSNAALHWMPDADRVAASVAAALRPGGRFVGEFGGHGNVAAMGVALVAALRAAGVGGLDQHPWYYPSADEHRSRLEAAGFVVESIELIPRPTPLPGPVSEWLDMFAGPFLDGLDADDRRRVLDDAEGLLAPWLRDGAGRWTADYVRLRFRAALAG
ncbi:MAG TPA: methyltransferase domain-containing protein [Acidimicrobiales bacterium]